MYIVYANLLAYLNNAAGCVSTLKAVKSSLSLIPTSSNEAAHDPTTTGLVKYVCVTIGIRVYF